jgi:tetratricopeptide (TPR) repeat protein
MTTGPGSQLRRPALRLYTGAATLPKVPVQSMVMRRTAVLLVLIALVLTLQPVRAQDPADRDVMKLFEAAVAAQQAGDLAAAEAQYLRFLQHQPRNLEALVNLGVVYASLGRFDEAIASYKKALEISFLSAPVRLNLALAYYKAGRCAEAVPEFTTVLDANPGAFNALVLKADCHLQLGEFQKAIALLEPIADDHKDESAFNYVFGMALLQDKQTEKASVYLDRILKQGDSAEAHVLMGVAKRAAGDYAEAREEFRKAVALNETLPVAHSLLGQASLSTGDRETARTAFQQELAINPNDFESNLYLGLILKEDREFAAARAHIDRAIVLRPADPGARYQLATIMLASNEPKETVEAARLLETLVSESPAFVEAHVSLATAYYRLKRKEDGDREREIVAKLNAEAQARQPGQSAPSPQE